MKTKTVYVVQSKPVFASQRGYRWVYRTEHKTTEKAQKRIRFLRGAGPVFPIRYRIIKRTEEVVYE